MSLKSFTEWIALTFQIIFLLRKHFQISPDKTYFTPEAYLPPIIKTKMEQTHTCSCKIGSPTAELQTLKSLTAPYSLGAARNYG